MTDHTTLSNVMPGRTTQGLYCRAAHRAVLLALILLLLPLDARASLLSPEAEDAMAKYLALFVIFVVPVVLITLFWMVHILPEKIAHKRHHPQFEAIRTLCLLSLVFGGLLWPLAWIWAYSKPVIHRLAYGPSRHDEDFVEPYPGEPPAPASEVLRERLARLEAKGLSEADLKTITADLDALEAKLAGSGH